MADGDPEFREGCSIARWPGRKRNWLTGYCRVPCAEGEQRHPQTGVCTTLDDLEHEGVDLGRQFEYGAIDPSIVDRSALDKRDRFDPNHEGNAWCPAGKELNLATGKCKNVPQPKRWQAINPRTGRVVTREYLKRQEPEPYIYLGEDDLEHENTKWSPQTDTMITNRPGNNADTVAMREFIKNSRFSVADLRTMRGVEEASRLHGITEDGQGGGDSPAVIGIYSPIQRKKCEASTFTRLIVSDFYACGFRKAVNLLDGDQLDDFIIHKGNPDEFIFVYTGAEFDALNLKGYLKVSYASGQDRKLLVIEERGVWRLLIRFLQSVQPQYNDGIDSMELGNIPFDNEPRLAAAMLDGFENNVIADILSVSYHEFDNETLV